MNKHQKWFVIIRIVLILIVIGGAVYYFFNKESSRQTAVTNHLIDEQSSKQAVEQISDIDLIKKYYANIKSQRLEDAYNMYFEKKVLFDTFKNWYGKTIAIEPSNFFKNSEGIYEFDVVLTDSNNSVKDKQEYFVKVKIKDNKIDPVSSERRYYYNTDYNNIYSWAIEDIKEARNYGYAYIAGENLFVKNNKDGKVYGPYDYKDIFYPHDIKEFSPNYSNHSFYENSIRNFDIKFIEDYFMFAFLTNNGKYGVNVSGKEYKNFDKVLDVSLVKVRENLVYYFIYKNKDKTYLNINGLDFGPYNELKILSIENSSEFIFLHDGILNYNGKDFEGKYSLDHINMNDAQFDRRSAPDEDDHVFSYDITSFIFKNANNKEYLLINSIGLFGPYDRVLISGISWFGGSPYIVSGGKNNEPIFFFIRDNNYWANVNGKDVGPLKIEELGKLPELEQNLEDGFPMAYEEFEEKMKAEE